MAADMKRVIQGLVVAKSGDKTASVLVERRFKKYLVHDEKNQLNIGDTVSAIECRPLSKAKKFRLKAVLKTGVE